MEFLRGKRVHYTEWVEGQYYFRANGTSAFRLDEIVPVAPWNKKPETNYRATYVNGPSVTDTKTFLIEAIVNKGENDMTNTLYEFELDGKTTFGSKIATNSNGLWVMEVKGSGEVITVEKTKVEEVVPHTVGVKFIGTPDTTHHYTAPKGKFDLGFYLFENHNGPSLVQVVELDTKSKKATKEFTPTLKFVTEAVE